MDAGVWSGPRHALAKDEKQARRLAELVVDELRSVDVAACRQ
jgi:hypothetical protein